MKTKIYIHTLLDSPQASPQVAVYSVDLSEYNCGTVIEVREIEVDLPSHDALIAGQVEQLKKERDKIYNDAASRAASITERLERFLAITNEPQEIAP